MYGFGVHIAKALTIAPRLIFLSSFIRTQLRTWSNPPPATPRFGLRSDGPDSVMDACILDEDVDEGLAVGDDASCASNGATAEEGV